MKKVFLTMVICISMTFTHLSFVNAATVRISDLGVYNLVREMRAVVYDINKEMKNFVPVVIKDATRATHLDKDYSGYKYAGYSSGVYQKGISTEKARINFYANPQGYVSRIDYMIFDAGDNQVSGMTFGTLMIALGLSKDEYLHFYKRLWNKTQDAIASGKENIDYRDSIYCSAKKRYFDMRLYQCNKGHLHAYMTGRT